MENKNEFDVIYLNDKELGINSQYDTDRPCLLIKIDIDNGDGWVVPLTTNRNISNWDNNNMYRLSFGSWVDFEEAPIHITKAMVDYSNKDDFKVVDGKDLEELEYRYQEWLK